MTEQFAIKKLVVMMTTWIGVHENLKQSPDKEFLEEMGDALYYLVGNTDDKTTVNDLLKGMR